MNDAASSLEPPQPAPAYTSPKPLDLTPADHAPFKTLLP
jgi:hypothetical protein